MSDLGTELPENFITFRKNAMCHTSKVPLTLGVIMRENLEPVNKAKLFN